MTSQLSSPSAAFMSTLSYEEAITVGSHRLSRVSVRRKITSFALINSSSFAESASTAASSVALPNAWPGIGIVATTPVALTPGKIRCKAAAAAIALKAPPDPLAPPQSPISKSDCLTGFEYDTRPLSTKVICLTPHAMSVRATPHPKVPAPRRRHFVFESISVSKSGSSLHRMSFRLRSTLCSAIFFSSITLLRFTIRGPIFPLALDSHPTTL
mmetsp:Transcript_19139/g.28497  ORF Transcript_19139/g.28497 Transcript_19139/m.28497 type:complete len:213 (+) Transcript_19139:692-1330(+)